MHIIAIELHCQGSTSKKKKGVMRKHPTQHIHSRHYFSLKERHPESLRNGILTAKKIARAFLRQNISVLRDGHVLKFPHGLPSFSELRTAIKNAYLQTVVSYELDTTTNCMAF